MRCGSVGLGFGLSDRHRAKQEGGQLALVHGSRTLRAVALALIVAFAVSLTVVWALFLPVFLARPMFLLGLLLAGLFLPGLLGTRGFRHRGGVGRRVTVGDQADQA